MTRPEYPPSRRDPVEDTLFGESVPDPYRWLEYGSSPEVGAWTDAQNGLVRAYLTGCAERDGILRELEALLRYDDIGCPAPAGGRLFYSRKTADSQFKECVWREGTLSEERLLLNPSDWSPDGSVTLGRWFPSPDGRKVAAKIHKNNSDDAVLRIFDVDSGAASVVDDVPAARLALPQWLPDSSGFYYVGLPDGMPANDPAALGKAEVRLHLLGTPFSGDGLVHPATGDASLWMACHYFGGRRLYVCLYRGHGSTVVLSRDLDSGAVATVFDEPGASAVLSGLPDKVFAWTNAGASNGRLLLIDVDGGGKPWRELVPEQEAILTRAVVAGGKLALCYMRHAKIYIEIYETDGTLVNAVLPPGEASTVTGISGDAGHPELYYSVGSFTQPGVYYSLELGSRDPKLFFRSRRGGDLFAMTRMRFYQSADGTRVPLFILRPMGSKGPIPFILKAYGGFGVPYYPEFGPEFAAWIKGGGGFAVACIRGGGEYGKNWHEAGRLGNKQNGFDDFYAAAEFLFREKHATADRLGIWGRSNGGLLVAASVTQRPELFRAALCEVPLTDMLRYDRFGIARIWKPEYGDPALEEEFRWLKAYSPYHNVAPGKKYPVTLIAANARDDRVDPLHARKMAAALQHAADPASAIYLHIQEDAGHDGSGVTNREVDRKADYLAFFARELGLDFNRPPPTEPLP